MNLTAEDEQRSLDGDEPFPIKKGEKSPCINTSTIAFLYRYSFQHTFAVTSQRGVHFLAE